MSAHIDLFYNTYANFTDQVLAAVPTPQIDLARASAA